MKTLSFLLSVVFVCCGYAQQTAAVDQAKKNAVLEGKVVNSKTGEPLRKVSLTLRPMGGPGTTGAGAMTPAAPYAATTDAEGKFKLDNVEPGRYMLSAERQGFVGQQYGARKNRMGGT